MFSLIREDFKCVNKFLLESWEKGDGEKKGSGYFNKLNGKNSAMLKTLCPEWCVKQNEIFNWRI